MFKSNTAVNTNILTKLNLLNDLVDKTLQIITMETSSVLIYKGHSRLYILPLVVSTPLSLLRLFPSFFAIGYELMMTSRDFAMQCSGGCVK